MRMHMQSVYNTIQYNTIQYNTTGVLYLCIVFVCEAKTKEVPHIQRFPVLAGRHACVMKCTHAVGAST